MDLTSGIGSVFAAFGLSGAAGLNAWLPLFGGALLERLDVVDLAAPFDELSTTSGLIILGVLTVADFVGDKVPAVDHALHALGAFVAPASGAVLFTGQTGLETEIPTVVSALSGGGVAGLVHLARASIRPLSTLGTGGIGNPLLSLAEDAGSITLMAVAFLVPVLAFLVVAAGLAGAMVWWLRRRRLRGARPRG